MSKALRRRPLILLMIVAGSDPIGGVRVVELIDSAVKGEE